MVVVEDVDIGIELAPPVSVPVGSRPRCGVPEVVEDLEGLGTHDATTSKL